MAFFTDERLKEAEQIIAQYPQRKAAIMPLLWMVQEQFGYIPHEVVPEIAELTGTTPVHVEAIIKFYEMFHDHPVGKCQLMLCTNISCLLWGADKTLQRFKEVLGIEVGETTPDGLFTLEEFECLAACDKAPVLLVNAVELFEQVTPDKVEQIIAELRRRYGDGTKAQ
ncbi:MAG: NAD(P)H-dependent oxidoreductase subunit E [Armatimonadota bacterium]|jgi:NADH-quinone oxidoreductase E subunit|nr:NAD(P)H-dependent oxidoreductase subunit E [Armatimonadota bacterium]MDT7971917.1 NAD(P)H-dependent oxidoreductase subunit E [Armatimonadota bacterium]